MATALWKKLNLKDESRIVVIDSPESFEEEIATLSDVTVGRKLISASKDSFLIAFVTRLVEVEKVAVNLTKMAAGDITIWLCYPKGTSKRYKCEFTRDTGWEALGGAGFEPVRMVAIDEDWSALRFRRVEYIKKMTRDPRGALTAEGKARARKL
jgi:hypothetical protein